VSKKIRLFSVALVVLVVVLVAFAGTALAAGTDDHSLVIGSAHDLAQGGNSCESCHTPHDSKGAFLWAYPVNTVSGPGVSVPSGASTAIKPLCYSCHDGTITVNDPYAAFDPTTAQHLTKSKAVYGKTGRDCDLCHDPHNGPRTFIRYTRTSGGVVSTWPDNSPKIISNDPNVCASCHSDKQEGGVDRSWKGPNGTVNPPGPSQDPNNVFHNHVINATASAFINPAPMTYVPGTSWGTRLFSNQTKCESCHSPHGAYAQDTLNTMDVAGGALCINCHK